MNFDLSNLTDTPYAAIAVIIVIFLVILWMLTQGNQGKSGYKLTSVFEVERNLLHNPDDEVLDFLGHMNKGNEYLAVYDFDKALAHFYAALKLKKKDETVHFKIGRVFLQKEDYKNAVTAFKNVVALNPQHTEAYFELARIFNIQKRPKETHLALDQVLSIDATHEESLKLKIRLFEKEENWAALIPALERLIDRPRLSNPNKYRLKYAHALTELQRYSDAITTYELLAEKNPPDEVLYHSKIANIYLLQGNDTKAIEFFRKVINSSDPLAQDITIQLQMGSALCNEGVRYYQDGDRNNALTFYQEALSFDKNNSDIHFNLGKCYIDNNQPELAEQSFTEALRLNPGDGICAYELALLADQTGKIDQAIQYYLLTISLIPTHSQACFGLGALYGIQGNLEMAVQYLSETIRLNPRHEDAIYNLGVALEQLEKPEKAIQMYKKVLTLNKYHEQAKSNLLHLERTKKR